MRLTLLTALCLALAACSPSDEHKTTNDLKETAGNLGGAIKQAVNSPSGAALKEDAKDLAGDLGKALKKGAGELKEGAQDAKHMADEKVAEEKRSEKKR
jgi:hypothetical protein